MWSEGALLVFLFLAQGYLHVLVHCYKHAQLINVLSIAGEKRKVPSSRLDRTQSRLGLEFLLDDGDKQCLVGIFTLPLVPGRWRGSVIVTFDSIYHVIGCSRKVDMALAKPRCRARMRISATVHTRAHSYNGPHALFFRLYTAHCGCHACSTSVDDVACLLRPALHSAYNAIFYCSVSFLLQCSISHLLNTQWMALLGHRRCWKSTGDICIGSMGNVMASQKSWL